MVFGINMATTTIQNSKSFPGNEKRANTYPANEVRRTTATTVTPVMMKLLRYRMTSFGSFSITRAVLSNVKVLGSSFMGVT